jgi:hypothetical protein
MKTFLQRFGNMIKGTLSGFDRLRFRGTRRLLAHVSGLKHFLWHSRVLLKDFDSYVQGTTATLCTAIEKAAKESGRPLVYVASGNENKGNLVEEVMKRDGIREGLIGVWSCVEVCSSYVIFKNKYTHKLELRIRPRKCLHYYHYYQHPQLGLLHTRLQTWFPFTMQICLNGREWLGRQLVAANIGHRRRDNCFLDIDDVAAAQKLMDTQLRSDWPVLLSNLARLSDPTHDTLLGKTPVPYYWTVDQSEWATDILFHSAKDLAVLFPRLVRHGMDTLHSEDVMRFLGRPLTPSGKIRADFNEEVTTDLQRRVEGLRLKHCLAANSLKMYDKACDAEGAVLRLEATYNNIRNIRVFRATENKPNGEKAWRALRKGVADMSRRADISHKATERYAEALATMADKTPLSDLANDLCQPVQWKGRQVRALNPLNPADATLLESVNRGEFLLDGFSNRDIRRFLYATSPANRAEDRSRSAAVTRRLRMLRAHGLIQKIPKSHRYQVSQRGRTAIAALLAARHADAAKLTAAA